MNKLSKKLQIDIEQILGKIAYRLDKAYMQRLANEYFAQPSPTDVCFTENIRAIKIKKFVYNKNEQVIDCMKNIYAAFSNTKTTIAVVVHRSVKDVTFYFICKNTGKGRNSDSKDNLELMKSLFSGNFPGSSFDSEFSKNGQKLMEEFSFMRNPTKDNSLPPNVNSISIVSAIPSEKSEKYISQGIEKIINGMVPTNENAEYSIVFLAEPLSQDEIRLAIQGFEELASQISPFITQQVQESSNFSKSDSTSHSVAKTHSLNIGLGIPHIANAGYGYSHNTNDGKAHSETEGSGESSTYTLKDYRVFDLSQKLEKIIKRLTEAQSTGIWNEAVYILAKEKSVSLNVAQSLNGLICGDESYTEPSSIQTFMYSYSNKQENDFDRILESINKFSHPVFLNKYDFENHNSLIYLTPTTYVSTTEIAKIVSLPKHSLPGIPVIECAEFGRTVSSYNYSKKSRTITLGNIYNMHAEEKLPVELDIDSLSSHVFITGSTGSGKSNTVYQLLDSLKQNEVKFLVVEPAKGEYKNVFGQDETDELHCNVHVYGTNSDISSLLRINPFSFPNGNEDPSKNIHILEHLDRLIEIFNVCWPMYAAMPAVLKEAVEKSYEDCGWNLTESTNEYGKDFYPTFADVTRNIRTIIDSSEYDKDNKGAYKGSLITRLKSLTNGINGLIFTTDEISSKDLFDENVIVDLSRVGSSETKSLIMGLLVLKLQEYRMTSGAVNSNLHHVTVLEEAHNLLKRTNTEQSSESGNLIGKSVEMLTNSIAEMRTYGEGFIIADQAPALLDMAVIRNTNTKIIMRLPDKDDRELVGKAANLNDDQIIELAKLPRGVAAVYQNEWVEAVLCKINYYQTSNNKYRKSKTIKLKKELNQQQKLDIVNLLFYGTELPTSTLKDLNECNLSARSKVIVQKWQKDSSNAPEFMVTSSVVTELFKEFAETLKNTLKISPCKQAWTDAVNKIILETLNINNNNQLRIDINQAIMTEVLLNEFNKNEDYAAWNKGGYLR